jgi:hypothetical protein
MPAAAACLHVQSRARRGGGDIRTADATYPWARVLFRLSSALQFFVMPRRTARGTARPPYAKNAELSVLHIALNRKYLCRVVFITHGHVLVLAKLNQRQRAFLDATTSYYRVLYTFKQHERGSREHPKNSENKETLTRAVFEASGIRFSVAETDDEG